MEKGEKKMQVSWQLEAELACGTGGPRPLRPVALLDGVGVASLLLRWLAGSSQVVLARVSAELVESQRKSNHRRPHQ